MGEESIARDNPGGIGGQGRATLRVTVAIRRVGRMIGCMVQRFA